MPTAIDEFKVVNICTHLQRRKRIWVDLLTSTSSTLASTAFPRITTARHTTDADTNIAGLQAFRVFTISSEKGSEDCKD